MHVLHRLSRKFRRAELARREPSVCAIGRGEGEEDVARVVPARAAPAADPDGSATCEPVELVRKQRRIGPDDHNDAAPFLLLFLVLLCRTAGVSHKHVWICAHGHTADDKVFHPAVVGLN